jgi:lysozyme
MNNHLTYDVTGINLTELSEGCSLISYWDDKGKCWTIGVGHTGPDVYQGLTITQAQADALLYQDIQTAEDAVNRLVTVPLTQDQFDALVDFVFNEGQGHFCNSTLLKLLNAGDYAGADEQFSEWNLSGGQVVAALTKRRADEASLFNT